MTHPFLHYSIDIGRIIALVLLNSIFLNNMIEPEFPYAICREYGGKKL